MLPAVVFARDHTGRFTLVNRAMAQLYGTTPEALIGKTDADVHPDPDVVAAIQREDQEMLQDHRERIIAERVITDAQGEQRRLHIVKRPLFDAAGAAFQVLGVATDISERQHMEEQLRQVNRKLTYWVRDLEQRNRDMTLLTEMSDVLQSCQALDEAYQEVARFARQMFPRQSGALYMLNDSHALLEAVARWGSDPPEELVFGPEGCWALRSGHPHHVEQGHSGPRCRHVTLTGMLHDAFPYMCIPLQAQGKTLGVLHIRYMPATSRYDYERLARLGLMVARHLSLALANLQLRAQLHDLSIRDPLTGLYNRRYLDEALERELLRATRHQHPVGVIMLDIDHFKQFNDTYGHDAGDALLRALGTFLLNNIRGEDIACRYGGEEFTLILPTASLSDTQARAEDLRASINHLQAMHIDQWIGHITISLGAACFPQHGTSGDGLVRAADRALYQAKMAGRNCVVVAS
jgi:diguanylate cyclase (GGDEF)-like protein/PAS domain S-box-containing protein